MYTTSIADLSADSTMVVAATAPPAVTSSVVPMYYCSNCSNFNAHVGWGSGATTRAPNVLMWRPEWHQNPLMVGADGTLTELVTAGGPFISMIWPCGNASSSGAVPAPNTMVTTTKASVSNIALPSTTSCEYETVTSWSTLMVSPSSAPYSASAANDATMTAPVILSGIMAVLTMNSSTLPSAAYPSTSVASDAKIAQPGTSSSLPP
jgi:hypothetical protein